MAAAQLVLESARPPDARTIALLSRRLVERGLTWRWTPRAIAAQIRDPDVEVLVARRDGAVAGFAVMQFRFEARRAHLVLLAVDPRRRRSGVGRALVSWLELVARRGGIRTVELEVRSRNLGARAFYAALGYAESGVLRRYYQGREDAVRMRRDLARTAR